MARPTSRARMTLGSSRRPAPRVDVQCWRQRQICKEGLIQHSEPGLQPVRRRRTQHRAPIAAPPVGRVRHYKATEDVWLIKSNPGVLPRVDPAGVGQLLQCRLLRSGEGTYPGMMDRPKLRPLDIALICRPHDLLDAGPPETPDAALTEEAVHRVWTDDRLNILHRVRRSREAQRGVMSKEPQPVIVAQLVVGNDL